MLLTSLNTQVEIDNIQISQVALRTRCRQLESESMFPEIFDKYEELVEKLQADVQMLKAENGGLANKLVAREMGVCEAPQSEFCFRGTEHTLAEDLPDESCN